ncbi:hypothetical protein ILUMI_09386 [Ignelater luminosus]|uniref:Scavenger receptor class B member 1 n=1 Tax=Ignelater luminosus TaxID=2038154 RepID=A0A8K0GF38_IGNLU|nr:hypothetical protein ILUMI_09386 [Ignelater luminosus]
MKDAIVSWSRILRRSYSAVSTDANERTTNNDDCPVNSPQNVALGLFRGNFRGILAIAFLGLLGIGSGIFILVAHPYDILFKLKCVFTEGGEVFELWRTPPIDLYLKVYLYNVTNKDAFLNGTEKLKVQEVGPYVYREALSHENVTFNANGTVSAIPHHPLVWIPELSEGHQEDDQVIMPHIALLSIGHVVSSASVFTQFGLNLVIRQTDSQPLMQMSAKDFMFGYDSTLISLGYRFMPNWIYFDKVGLIDRMYDFEGDFETVYTGENDIRETGLLDTYRGSRSLPQWEGDCGNIHNASDGTKFASYIKPNQRLLFFRKNMCRAQTLVLVNKTTRSGLDGYVYNFEENALDNGKYRPENKCFCKSDNCMPTGLLDVNGCYYGFPIATSYPHFLDADPSVRDYVEGSHPDPEKHRSYFIVQPESGLPIEVAARFQINMVLGDLNSIAHVEKFSNMILPLLWTETTMQRLPESLANRFRLYLNVLPVFQTAMIYFSFIIGTILVIVAAYKYIRKIKTFGKVYKSAWSDEFVEEDINRKLSTYSYVPEKRASLSSKELEIYFSSLITPLNQDITFEEFQNLKEENI